MLQRSDDVDPERSGVGPIIRSFAGPEFVKSADTTADGGWPTRCFGWTACRRSISNGRGLRVERTDAVRDVSFTLQRGRVTALVGQSGSGKSTLAKMITGVETPTTGSITFYEGDDDQAVGALRGRALRR